jgi:hypothetical protein
MCWITWAPQRSRNGSTRAGATAGRWTCRPTWPDHRNELGARRTIPPHHIYLNIAYHLSTEARAGLSQFRLPGRFEQELFEFQKSAVKIAARHLHRRGGVMIGDVVGLGKTMMATALARMFEDDLGYETFIICPKNLEPMWERYRTEYGLRGMVLPVRRSPRSCPTSSATAWC